MKHTRAHTALTYIGDFNIVEAINAVISSSPPDAWTCVTIGGSAALSLTNVSGFTERVSLYGAEMQRRRLEEQAANRMTGFDGVRRQAATAI